MRYFENFSQFAAFLFHLQTLRTWLFHNLFQTTEIGFATYVHKVRSSVQNIRLSKINDVKQFVAQFLYRS